MKEHIMYKCSIIIFSLLLMNSISCSQNKKIIQELASIGKENITSLKSTIRSSNDSTIKKYGPSILAFLYAQQTKK